MKRFYWLILALFWMTACGTPEDNPQRVTDVGVTTTSATPTLFPPIISHETRNETRLAHSSETRLAATPSETRLAHSSETRLAATPSETRLAATVAYPPEIAGILQQALSHLTNTNWQWQLLPATDPAHSLATGQADVAILPNDSGMPAGDEPLALALPFTEPNDQLSWTNANEKAYPPCQTPIAPPPCWVRWRLLQPPAKAATLEWVVAFRAKLSCQTKLVNFGGTAGIPTRPCPPLTSRFSA